MNRYRNVSRGVYQNVNGDYLYKGFSDDFYLHNFVIFYSEQESFYI